MRGALKTLRTGPASTTRPAYITIIRSAISATTPRLCVMKYDCHRGLFLKALEQREDLRLYGDVQRRCGLIGDQNAWAARQAMAIMTR